MRVLSMIHSNFYVDARKFSSVALYWPVPNPFVKSTYIQAGASAHNPASVPPWAHSVAALTAPAPILCCSSLYY